MPHISNLYHFRDQHDGEEILHIIHRHWFNILTHFLVILLFAGVLIASTVLLPTLFPEILNVKTASFFIFIENTFFIFIWLFSFLLWIDYYFDVWIITNERIVNIEQRGLFVRQISELNFSRIQDVTATVTGILPTVLNYGEVLVQTAGEENLFIFHQVPDPYKIKDVLMQLSKGALDTDLRKVADTLRTGEAAL